MDLHVAEQMAIKAFHEHGLAQDGWRFKWTTGKVTFGVCRPTRKEIGLSRTLTLLNNEAEVRDTILHEVAHALAGHAAGHGPEWRRIARQIGCDGNRTHQAVTPPAAWTGTCPNGHTLERHRLTEKAHRLACGTCCRAHNGGRFSAEFMFKWTKA